MFPVFVLPVYPVCTVHYSLLAGEGALAVRAYEEALAHFQRGLTAREVDLTGSEPATDVEEAALLDGLGQARDGTVARHNRPVILATLTRAFDYYVESGDSERAVVIAAYHLPMNTGEEIIERALALVPPDSHDAGRLLSRQIATLRPIYERAQAVFDRAIAIAHQHQDPSLEMQTLVSGACVDFHHYRHQQSLDRNRLAIELKERVDLPMEEAHAHYDLFHVGYALGDQKAAARHVEEMIAPAERSRTDLWRANAMEANENLSSAKGDWQAARNFSDQGLAISPQEPNLLGCRALLEFQVGDFDAGQDYLNQLLETMAQNQTGKPTRFTFSNFTLGILTVPAVVIPMTARISGVINRFDIVENIGQSIISSPNAFPGARYTAQIGLALIAVQRSDRVAAGELYSELAPIQATMSPQCPMGPGLAVDRLLGLLAHTMGELDQAAEHFEDSLAFCRKAGYRPELAWTCCDSADMLLQRNHEDDRAKARSLLDESLDISNELGMRPLMQRVLSRQEILRA